MGRFGVGHGAFAIRDRRRRARRASLNDGSSQHHHQRYPENYMHFYNLHQQRKNSVTSSQSAPVKGTAGGDASTQPDLAIIPGQMPPSYDQQETKSLPGGTEILQPGPSWWPGPPLQQGGIVLTPQHGSAVAPPLKDRFVLPALGGDESSSQQNTGKGLLSGVVGLFTGQDTWTHIQDRLLPHLQRATRPPPGSSDGEAATKVNHRVSFVEEVGRGGCPQVPQGSPRTSSSGRCQAPRTLPHTGLSDTSAHTLLPSPNLPTPSTVSPVPDPPL